MVAVANKNLQSKFKLRAFKLTQFINYYSFVCGAQQAWFAARHSLPNKTHCIYDFVAWSPSCKSLLQWFDYVYHIFKKIDLRFKFFI
jgi:hypothetical protein